MSVQGRQRLLLSKLNEQLTCRLCSGYFIDATTIIECLHSFCRSCIVKYLEKSKYCPICEVQVHKSKPLLNIRPDHTLQDIVYKLVPGCYQNEMRSRREFYANHPEAKTTASPESRGEPAESHIYSPEESLSLSLEYHNPSLKTESEDEETESPKTVLPRRYLRCPAAVTIFHLQKLIRAKYGLSEAHRIDILYKEEALSATYTLMDVMYIYHWRRKVPLHLSYRIFESSPKRIKLSEDNAEFKKSLSDSGIGHMDSQEDEPHKEWKEVQLKISETGVMSVTDITSPESKKNVRTMEIDNKEKSELSSTADSKPAKEIIEQNVKSSNETLKEKSKPRVKEENEGTMTRSASKLNASKLEEAKTKNEEKTTNTKMDTRASAKEAEKKSEKSIKEAKNENQVLTNNNSINSEKESENQKQQSKPSSAGSKINALSAKLQFQPKVGQVNNTYSKKGPMKEKKVVTYNLKNIDSKLSKPSVKSDSKTESQTKTQIPPKANMESTTTVASTVTTSTVTTQISSSTATSSITTSTSTPKVSSGNTTLSSKTTTTSSPKVSSGNTTLSSKTTTIPTISTTTRTPTGKSSTSAVLSSGISVPTSTLIIQTTASSAPVSLTTSATVSQSASTQPTPKVQKTYEKSEVKSSMTITPVVPSPNTSSTSISYTVTDMVNKRTFNLGPKSSTTSVSYSKSPVSICSTSSSSTGPQINIQNPLMSIYSMKSNAFTSSTSNITTLSTNTSSVSTSTSSTTPTIKTEPKSDSIPPCPDAIPLSMMKNTMRKNQLFSKGINSSDSSTKLSTPGSKIDDICAKIGENSKEKNKLENRSKPEIPGLLEIPKKPSSSAEQVLKQIPSIHVPIFKPSNKEVNLNSSDSYKILPSISSHSLQPNVSSTSQKVSSSKKRVSPFSYKTLRNPPRSWNPTLSKSSYLAIKNQAKELQQQQAFACDSKQIPSKPSKIFTMRNTPRYLGNPASGVKPMYGSVNDTTKDKEQSSASSSSKSHTVNMTKIDPQTLQPISSMVPSPPYSTNERTYQSVPFSSRDIRSTSSPVSPRNSPVNMLSTSPFIPSPTPNTNPRLIYSTFPPTFPNASRFPHSIMPHSPLGLPTPLSAFHSSLPQVKFYQRSSYAPQPGGYGAVGQPPTVQRIPPTSHSNSPKSPKMTVDSKGGSSSSGSMDPKSDEGQRIPKVTLSRKVDNRVFNLAKSDESETGTPSRKVDGRMFNLAKPDGSETKTQMKLDFHSKISAASGIDRSKASPVAEKKDNKVDVKSKTKPEEAKGETKESKNEKDAKEEVKSHNKVNGAVAEVGSKSVEEKTEGKLESSNVEEDKSSKNDTANGMSQEIGDKLEDGTWRKTAEQVQAKKVEVQRNKAES